MKQRYFSSWLNFARYPGGATWWYYCGGGTDTYNLCSIERRGMSGSRLSAQHLLRHGKYQFMLPLCMTDRPADPVSCKLRNNSKSSTEFRFTTYILTSSVLSSWQNHMIWIIKSNLSTPGLNINLYLAGNNSKSRN